MTTKEIHLRLWSSNSKDINAACGLFSRTYYKDTKWTHDFDLVTCQECKEYIRMRLEETEIQMQFEYIRQTVQTNMVDRLVVARLANELHFYALVTVAGDARGQKYFKLLGEFESPDEYKFDEWKRKRGLNEQQEEKTGWH